MNQEDIERNVAFIIEHQAKFFADLEEMKARAVEQQRTSNQSYERLTKAGERTDRRLKRATRLGVIAVRQEREKRRQVEEEWTAKINILIDAQIRFEERQEVIETKRQEWRAKSEESIARLETAMANLAASSEASAARHEAAMAHLAADTTARLARSDESAARLEAAMADLAQAVTGAHHRIDAMGATR